MGTLTFEVVDLATGYVNDAEAVFTWLDGHDETVTVHRVGQDRAFVSWPESRREMSEVGMVSRPSSWVDRDRLEMPRVWEVRSPNGVDHLMVNRRCATCGLGHDWLPTFGGE